MGFPRLAGIPLSGKGEAAEIGSERIGPHLPAPKPHPTTNPTSMVETKQAGAAGQRSISFHHEDGEAKRDKDEQGT